LDQILSKTRSEGISADLSDTSSATADPEPETEVCGICGGAGFVRRPYPVDHPRFGKAEPCDCVLTEDETVRRNRLERISNIGALRRFTFENLVPTGRGGESDWFERAYEAVKAYAEAPEGWLVLSG